MRSADPGRKGGDGMKAAMREPARDKGKPARPADPGKAKGDGLKAAMRDQGRSPSKLSPMGAAKKRER